MTDEAKAHLAKLGEENEVVDPIALRLVFENDELRLMADAGRDGDTNYDHEGSTVLMVDERIGSVLENNTLEINDGSLALR